MPLRDDLLERAKARVGMVLDGKWHLDSVLGIGGMATVYAATHRNRKRVAIKMLHPEVSIDKQVTTRFPREGYLANPVGHPGTVSFLDDEEGQIKVLDFGIARLRELTAGQTAGSTRSGSLLGTPAFMSPEQARGRSQDVDERTDLWAVGATMYTLLSGKYVHEAETINEQLILTA